MFDIDYAVVNVLDSRQRVFNYCRNRQPKHHNTAIFVCQAFFKTFFNFFLKFFLTKTVNDFDLRPHPVGAVFRRRSFGVTCVFTHPSSIELAHYICFGKSCQVFFDKNFKFFSARFFRSFFVRFSPEIPCFLPFSGLLPLLRFSVFSAASLLRCKYDCDENGDNRHY